MADPNQLASSFWQNLSAWASAIMIVVGAVITMLWRAVMRPLTDKINHVDSVSSARTTTSELALKELIVTERNRITILDTKVAAVQQQFDDFAEAALRISARLDRISETVASQPTREDLRHGLDLVLQAVKRAPQSSS